MQAMTMLENVLLERAVHANIPVDLMTVLDKYV